MNSRHLTVVTCAFGLCAAFARPARAGETGPAIIPRPVEMAARGEPFALSDRTTVLFPHRNAEVRAIGDYLATTIAETTGRRPRVVELPAGTTTLPGDRILLTLTGADAGLGDEGYTLAVSDVAVALRAATPCGLFRGTQTLRQLLTGGPDGAWQLPGVQIRDWPRYRHRGMLLDCGRHFMSKEFVKRYIDLLAYHKLNVLHWHLTEDQGWRIEIRKYPRLTEIGAWRAATRPSEQPRDAQGRYGGFYTQEDIKEIVAYARSRYITVIPELELPGHSLAALASHPELSCTGGPFQVGTRWGIYEDVYCAGNDRTFEFLEDVLSEVLELFPSEFVHIGGDECPKARWHACPKCQARIQAEGLKDEHELQSYFIRRIEKFLDGKGRRLIGWDEILEGGLAPHATVQSWRGMKGAVAAATGGHDVISSPTSHCYLDYAQAGTPGEPTNMGFVDLKTAYAFEPTPAELTPEQSRHVLGVEGNMWTEHAPQPRVDWQVFPRLCALAEVGWSARELRHWDDFAARMRTHYQRLDALGVTYFIPPPQPTSTAFAFADTVELMFEPPFREGAIRYTLDGRDPTASSPTFDSPVTLRDSAVVKARTFLRNGRTSDLAELKFSRLTPHEPVHIAGALPGLEYAYYEGEWERLPDFDALTPAARGVVPAFDLAVRTRDDRFALRFTGFLEVPAEGVYTFWLACDDGGRLRIGPDVIVDNDGRHPVREQRGVALLKAGRHPITLLYFEASEVEHLAVSYAGPGIAKQPVPPTALWHAGGQR